MEQKTLLNYVFLVKLEVHNDFYDKAGDLLTLRLQEISRIICQIGKMQKKARYVWFVLEMYALRSVIPEFKNQIEKGGPVEFIIKILQDIL